MVVVKGKKASKKRKISRAAQAKLHTRKVVYKPSVELCVGDKAITVAKAKKLLGWREAQNGEVYSRDIFSFTGKKIICENNVTNRPFYSSNLQNLRQEHLRKRWRFNGEPIIVGATGLILNGQHALVSLIKAAMEWENDQDAWGDFWDNEPTMEKVIVYGVQEDDDTVNTMDTCKPRSLMDVLYRSDVFRDCKETTCRVCSQMLDRAIRLLWIRTGTGLAAYAPRRTHAEALDFFRRHGKLQDCVRFMEHLDRTSERRLRVFSHPGYLAGLLYLIGSSNTDRAESGYAGTDSPEEKCLDWTNFDKAKEFFQLLADKDKSEEARKALATLLMNGSGSNAERWALITLLWIAYDKGTKWAADKLVAEITALYTTDPEDGSRVLSECPTVGGIDLGEAKFQDETDIVGNDPTPHQIKKRTKQLDKKAKASPSQVGSRKGKKWATEDTAWVFVADGDHYFGTIKEGPWEVENLEGGRCLIETIDGDTWEVDVKDLRLSYPGEVEKAAPAVFPSEKSVGKAKGKKAKAKKAAPKIVGTVGNPVWIVEKGKEAFRGHVVERNEKLSVVKVKIMNGFQGAGNVVTAPFKHLRENQPKVA